MIVLLVSGQIELVSSFIDKKIISKINKGLFLGGILITNPFILALLPTGS